jgi:hypothetical protein
VPVASSSISDPLAATLSAGTPVYMRIAVDRNVNNGSVPIGLIRQHQNGEKWQYFNIQASSTGVLASGTLTDDTNTSSSRLKGYGPMLAVGKGWDGRKDVLLLGHSIVNGGSRAQTPDDAADSRGNKVYSAMAFDNSSLTGGRIAFGNLAVPGITPSQQSLDPYNSDYYYRKAAVQLIAAQQGGRYPFTDIFFDIAANGATSDATAWQSALDSGIAFAKTLFPGTPIVMPTMTARTTNLNSRFWTTLADQGFSTAADGPGPNAPRQLVNSYILTKPNIDMAIDLRSALLADQNDKWPVRSFAATLTANAAVGSTSVSLSAAPDIGSILVFGPGDAANGEIVNGVKSVSGSGPYTVTFGEQVSLTKAHSASATVAESPTSDGIHPGVAFSQIVKDAMVSVINALGLP